MLSVEYSNPPADAGGSDSTPNNSNKNSFRAASCCFVDRIRVALRTTAPKQKSEPEISASLYYLAVSASLLGY